MSDKTAEAYKIVRDVTVCNDEISNAEKVSILELVKYELLVECHDDIFNQKNDD